MFHCRFLDLPEDIGRSILELCAEDAQCITVCARVSTVLKSWAEPILYRDLSIDSYHTMRLIHRTILDHPSKLPGFFARHVKSLRITCHSSWDQVMDLIGACSGVDTLRCQIPIEGPKTIDVQAHAGWKRIAPIYLAIPAEIFSPLSRTFDRKVNPMFSNVTRLDMHWDAQVRWNFKHLLSLRNLAQLCITTAPSSSEDNINESERVIRTAIPFFPTSLRVCILSIPWTQWHSASAKSIVERNSMLDHRIVVAVDFEFWRLEAAHSEDWIHQAVWRHTWGDPARADDAEDFWTRAEAKVNGRTNVLCVVVTPDDDEPQRDARQVTLPPDTTSEGEEDARLEGVSRVGVIRKGISSVSMSPYLLYLYCAIGAVVISVF